MAACGAVDNANEGSSSGSGVARDVHDASGLFLCDFDRDPKSVLHYKDSLLTILSSGRVDKSNEKKNGKRHGPEEKAAERE